MYVVFPEKIGLSCAYTDEGKVISVMSAVVRCLIMNNRLGVKWLILSCNWL